MAFKDRLKEARLKKGYTQEQLAKRIGIAKSTLTGYEKGNREPNISTISKILKELNIDANYLWQDELHLPTTLTLDEIEILLKKYRRLDSHGKEIVDFILLKEWERSTSSPESCNFTTYQQCSMAAEAINYSAKSKHNPTDITFEKKSK